MCEGVCVSSAWTFKCRKWCSTQKPTSKPVKPTNVCFTDRKKGARIKEVEENKKRRTRAPLIHIFTTIYCWMLYKHNERVRVEESERRRWVKEVEKWISRWKSATWMIKRSWCASVSVSVSAYIFYFTFIDFHVIIIILIMYYKFSFRMDGVGDGGSGGVHVRYSRSTFSFSSNG